MGGGFLETLLDKLQNFVNDNKNSENENHILMEQFENVIEVIKDDFNNMRQTINHRLVELKN